MIGFFLEPFHHSFRKRLSEKPKFYFFDLGVAHALAHRLTLPLVEKTIAFGEAFEHFIILEIIRLAHYFESDYRFSYLRTPSDLEVDLVIERPGKPIVFLEIKSSDEVERTDLSGFIRLTKDFGECEAIVLSQDPYRKKLDHVLALFWQDGIKYLFQEKLDNSNVSLLSFN